MGVKPLWPMVMLAWLYWVVPRECPYAARLARRGILCAAAVELPGVIYASIHGFAQRSSEPSPGQTILAVLFFAGMIGGFFIAGICVLLDAKRRH
jgi:hypothetical protein